MFHVSPRPEELSTMQSMHNKMPKMTIILTLICHYSGMNGKVVFSIPFLLDQEVILLRHSLLMDQVPVFLPMEPRLAPYGRPL